MHCRCNTLVCWLDYLFACRWRKICDRHDDYMTGK